MYLEEINALVDRQIAYGVIDEAFKKVFIELFTRQRDFSEGPDRFEQIPRFFRRTDWICDFDGKNGRPRTLLIRLSLSFCFLL
jgi:hypothetical protein